MIDKRTADKEKVVIFGNSIFAENIYSHLVHDSSMEPVAFTVDRAFLGQKTLFGLPVVPFETVESSFPPSACRMLLPISYQRMNRLREEKYLQARAKGYRLMSYVSSRSTVFPDLVLGDNCIILDNCVISPFVRMGNNVIVTDGAIIGHHAVLKDHCFVGAGAVVLGRVTLGEYSMIGANAAVKEEVVVAPHTLVGINAAITKNTRERGVYISQPAALHSRRSDQLGSLLSWPVRDQRAPEPASTRDRVEAALKTEPGMLP